MNTSQYKQEVISYLRKDLKEELEPQILNDFDCEKFIKFFFEENISSEICAKELCFTFDSEKDTEEIL